MDVYPLQKFTNFNLDCLRTYNKEIKYVDFTIFNKIHAHIPLSRDTRYQGLQRFCFHTTALL